VLFFGLRGGVVLTKGSNLTSVTFLKGAIVMSESNPVRGIRHDRGKGLRCSNQTVCCCLGPLVFDHVGISGAWIGSLARLEAYRPGFIVRQLGWRWSLPGAGTL